MNRLLEIGFKPVGTFKLNKEGELIGQNIDIESIKSMTAQEFEMFERGLSPGQRDLVNQALGLYN